jgi:hypothetical protein
MIYYATVNIITLEVIKYSIIEEYLPCKINEDRYYIFSVSLDTKYLDVMDIKLAMLLEKIICIEKNKELSKKLKNILN